MDYAEVNKQHFLVVIDVHSKWIEVLPTKLMTAEKTANLLRNLFASYGLPKVLVSDNGPQFTAPEFEQFLKGNGVCRLQMAQLKGLCKPLKRHGLECSLSQCLPVSG